MRIVGWIHWAYFLAIHKYLDNQRKWTCPRSAYLEKPSHNALQLVYRSGVYASRFLLRVSWKPGEIIIFPLLKLLSLQPLCWPMSTSSVALHFWSIISSVSDTTIASLESRPFMVETVFAPWQKRALQSRALVSFNNFVRAAGILPTYWAPSAKINWASISDKGVVIRCHVRWAVETRISCLFL